MPRMRVVPAAIAELIALQSDPLKFAEEIGCPAPEGWPEFPESIEFTLDRLRDHPDEAHWWMHFFLEDETLVGSGGFVGPPRDGVVEIGYEIAPEFRGKGLATAAAEALIDTARTAATITTVIAHTQPHHSPSTGVLRRLGFRWAGELTDPDDCAVWRWQLPIGG